MVEGYVFGPRFVSLRHINVRMTVLKNMCIYLYMNIYIYIYVCVYWPLRLSVLQGLLGSGFLLVTAGAVRSSEQLSRSPSTDWCYKIFLPRP